MAPPNLASINKNFQPPFKGEIRSESSHSQSTLQEPLVPEINDSINFSSTLGRNLSYKDALISNMHQWEPLQIRYRELKIRREREAARKAAEEKSEQAMTKEMKLARAVTILSFEQFRVFNWKIMAERLYSECYTEFMSFSDEVFFALASYVWNLYDKEELENMAFTDDIFKECKCIWESVCSEKGYFVLDSSLIDINKYEKVRELDLCNLLKWCNGNKSPYQDVHMDFSNFKSKVPLFQVPRAGYRETDIEKYDRISMNAMLASNYLDEQGASKKHLRMVDLTDGAKCLCVANALYMQSVKNININKIAAAVVSNPVHFGNLVYKIHFLFYRLIWKKIKRLNEYQRLVTYPLSVYGLSWEKEVEEVIVWADLKRRSEERRFIGTDHLLFFLHQKLLCESPYKSETLEHENTTGYQAHIKPSFKHKDTVYHLYQKAYEIATKLGHQIIGLEHLYVAITSANDESSWKHNVACVKKVKEAKRTSSEGKSELDCDLEPRIDPLKELGLDIRTVEVMGSGLWKKIQEDRFDLMIYSVLNKVDRRMEMSEREILNSLERSIKDVSAQPHTLSH